MRNTILFKSFYQIFTKKLEILTKSWVGGLKNMTQADVFTPPLDVRGMTELNREAFSKDVTVTTLKVPKQSLQAFKKQFKSILLKQRGARITEQPDDNASKYVMVRPDVEIESLSPDKIEMLKSLKIDLKFYPKELSIRYEHYKHQEILRAILPEGTEVTSGFERLGHIAHVNLDTPQLPYKNVIGQVLLDTHRVLKTVVNKSSTIANTFRVFEMEIIAGENNMLTSVVEYGNTFELDFSKVFWNSRLQEEHHRIVEMIPSSAAVFDVFAGVGPFSIPLAKKGCEVFANDLNPESHKWLCHNMKLNKASLKAFNMDGRQFLGTYLRSHLSEKESRKDVYVVMNLPMIAIEFLDSFQGLLADNTRNKEEKQIDEIVNTATIHVFCYGFSSLDNFDDIHTRANKALGGHFPESYSIREVRSVSPGKKQVCLSFQVPISVLLMGNKSSDKDEINGEEPEVKRRKVADVS